MQKTQIGAYFGKDWKHQENTQNRNVVASRGKTRKQIKTTIKVGNI